MLRLALPSRPEASSKAADPIESSPLHAHPGLALLYAARAPAERDAEERGVAWIDNANVKVIEVVLDRLAYGGSPEEIHFQHRRLPISRPAGSSGWQP